jgi:hypothetical protein
MSLLSLQGYLRIGTRLGTGKPGPLFWCGNVPEAKLELAEETTDRKESFSGSRLQYGRLGTGKTGTFSGTFDEWTLKNLALGLYSTPLATVGGSATGDTFPNGLVAGDQVRLAKPYASSLVITDSAGSPVTVPGTKYKLTGHNDAIVEMLDVLTYTQPFKAAYTYAGFDSLEVFTQAAPERYVVFDGINTETGEGVLIDIYRVRFDPFKDMGMIHNEYGSLAFTAAVLFDQLNVDAGGKGGYYRRISKT